MHLVRELEKHQRIFLKKNEENSKKRDCLKDKNEAIHMVEKLQKELIEHRNDLLSAKSRIRNLEVQMADKAE